MSFREGAYDPKVLVANLKAEIEMTEQEMRRKQLMEDKLINLINEIY